MLLFQCENRYLTERICMKTLFLVGLLLGLLFVPPCATVSVTLASASVSQGGTQTITTNVTNCGDKKTKFQVTVTASDAVGHILILRNDSIILNVNESASLQDIYAVAADAPLGTNRIISIAFHTANGSTTEIARDEKTFEVVP